VPASHAETQVHPKVPDSQAVFAAVGAGSDFADLIEMGARGHGPDERSSMKGVERSMNDLHYLSATEAVRLFRARKLSPVELVQAVIDRAQKVEPAINAFAKTFYD
jgi:hypothetical protein